MPETFSPAWEFYTPDPEIAEAVEADEYAPTFIDREGGNAGWQYTGNRGRKPDGTCAHCGARFVSTNQRQPQRFCGNQCASIVKEACERYRARREKRLAERPQVTRQCRVCGCHFLTPKESWGFSDQFVNVDDIAGHSVIEIVGTGKVEVARALIRAGCVRAPGE